MAIFRREEFLFEYRLTDSCESPLHEFVGDRPPFGRNVCQIVCTLKIIS